MAAVYRVQGDMPFSTLPAGSSFQIVWPAGPTETLRIVDPTSTVGAQPMRGTQVVMPRP